MTTPAVPAAAAPRLVPRRDTWGNAEEAGAWCIDPAAPPVGAAGPNAALAERLAASLAAFRGFARAWRVTFGSAEMDADPAGAALVRGEGEDPEAFAARAAGAIAAFAAPLYSAEVALELSAWVRTDESPEEPVRAWVRLADELRFWAGSEEEAPSACYTQGHTLFQAAGPWGEDNRALFRLNAPLLEAALKAWEAALGTVEVSGGFGGITTYGFTDEEQGE